MDHIEIKTLKELGDEFKERLNTIAKNEKGITGFPSGFHKLDSLTNGFQPSNLILIGGVAGMGSTAFALSLINKMTLENQCSIAYFSLELTAQQLMMRIISQQTTIDIEKLRLGLLNENEIELISQKTEELEETPLFIIDYPFLTVSDIAHKIYELICPNYGVDLIMIDMLHLIGNNSKDKVDKVLNKKELAMITFQLKKLAEKLNITIIVFVQLKEKLYGHGYYKRPLLSDIRKHAPIDKYADLILFLYRPEYYRIDEWDDDDASPTAGEAEIIVAKNSYGSIGNARVKFTGNLGGFDNLPIYDKTDSDLPF
ncbi:DnaB-like helicase C-terminal domain-containing protein [Flavobacterium sp. XS2P24]|uniref:DnaB-like helicase C-terminal domain-containing protein n=1 Tax=Flavobacterium sp. XS2P24 TaxID=3041249 RepID=UPI0024A84A1F|nr:DnaB-like helicase C-terminal domain-containing protein [Flavobacterium sp. XS2P24]MDI6050854.1 DnaB-like helicase C-terminal domain-containing protein [Flavobacterium sp. XS2P24]